MLKAFNQYVKSFDMNDSNIKLKYDHSHRVMTLSGQYAKKLGFNEKDIELAQIIGLLHDIGRFEQYQKYHSFSDSQTIDHADYGIKLLFNEGQISNFNIPKEYYEVIKFAIKNHNKLSIPKTDDPQKLKHAKLIRDIDKLDIVYLQGYLQETDLKTVNEPITDEVINCIHQHTMIDHQLCRNANDKIAVTFAFAFDIYNDICLPELKQNYKYLYERLNNKMFESIYLEVLKYIDERIEKNVRQKI